MEKDYSKTSEIDRTKIVDRSISYYTPRKNSGSLLHPLALLTATITFILIVIGGLVTSNHAGMSVPDWPNSYGYNMFLFPPSKWVGGILFEHTHRLMGTAVGFLATMLTLLAWAPGRTPGSRRWILRIFAAVTVLNAVGTMVMLMWPDFLHLTPPASDPLHILSQGAVTQVGLALCLVMAWVSRSPEPRRWVRWIATSCLIAVCIQGILGGLRVDLINLTLAIIHGCFAQASFCLIIFAAIITSQGWQTAPNLSGRGSTNRDRWLIRLAIVSVCILYCQLIIGAVMRHRGAGLAIPDLPWAYGKLIPPINASQLADANHFRIWKLDLDPVTLGQVWLHFAHRLGAIVVSIVLTSLICLIHRDHRNSPELRWAATMLALLLVAQVTLGILTVYLRKPADIASAHVAVGALVLGTTFTIAVRSMRLYSLCFRERVKEVSHREQPVGV